MTYVKFVGEVVLEPVSGWGRVTLTASDMVAVIAEVVLGFWGGEYRPEISNGCNAAMIV